MGPLDEGQGKKRLVSDINVTPLVDVMLVLLIIFMITAPMMTQGVDVNLPETTAHPLEQEKPPTVISINGKQEIFLGESRTSRTELKEQLAAIQRREGANCTVLLRADKEIPYGLVVTLMADVKEAGIDKLGMVTQPETVKNKP